MNLVQQKLAKLIDVKSLITLFITLIFGILCLCGVISPDQFMRVFELIIIFYFGTQVGKKDKEGG